jgi:Mrp family chromosome partitioning ATPase
MNAAAPHPTVGRLFLLTAPTVSSVSESELSVLPVLLTEARRIYDYVLIDVPPA